MSPCFPSSSTFIPATEAEPPVTLTQLELHFSSSAMRAESLRTMLSEVPPAV